MQEDKYIVPKFGSRRYLHPGGLSGSRILEQLGDVLRVVTCGWMR